MVILLVTIMLLSAANSIAFIGPKSYAVRSSSSYLSMSTGVTVTAGKSLTQVVRLRGTVDSGYGRGGKKLGFPTANLPSSLFQRALDKIPTGVYFGWALIEGTQPGRCIPHKAAVNIGYSPTFEGEENKQKIVEAHLILDVPLTDFYDEVMRLELLGYLRPEQKFDSFPALVQAITNDVSNAKACLDEQPYVSFLKANFLADASSPWTGKDGGDLSASWEFEDLTGAKIRYE
jgi:riboflavin kinase